MRFIPTPLVGAYLIEPERHSDERGFFARTWCQREFLAQGLAAGLVQCSISYNTRRGTVRGMHYQLPPFAEEKLVRVTHGGIFDVIVDLRPGSASFLHWFGTELTGASRMAMYVPKGVAHGFQTLADDTEVFYQMSEFYSAEHGCGLRWDDPLIRVAWPEPVTMISLRDGHYPDANLKDFTAFAGIYEDADSGVRHDQSQLEGGGHH
jgi:dTDP-4-dehydrorhamnose 3,5-epimerase